MLPKVPGQTLLTRAYRALLHLYPQEYRRSWGAGMEATFALRAREAHTRGLFARLSFATKELGNVLTTAAAEWRSHRRNFAQPRSPGPGRLDGLPRSPRRNHVANSIQDLRIALRGWRREPGTTAVIVVTLALGIGATTAVFSVVDGVLLRPLPFPEADRLVQVAELLPDGDLFTLSMPDFIDVREQSTSLDHVAVYDGASLTLAGTRNTEGVNPERVVGMEVTSGFFEMLGVDAAHGRAFTREDEAEDAPLIVMLGHSFWLARFGGNPDVLGDSLRIDGRSRTIVGVAPPGIRLGSDEPALWLPWPVTEDGMRNRGGHMYPVMGRVAEGSSFENARQEIALIGQRIASENPDSHENRGATIVPLRNEILGDVDRPLFVLLGAVAMLLLLACANVSSIMLARADARDREIAVRAALGAGSGQLVRQLLIETVLLAGAGGAVGVLIAHFGVAAIIDGIAGELPRAGEIGTDLRILAFALAATLGTGLIVGLVPAMRTFGADLYSPIKGGALNQTRGSARASLRRGLVVAEIALAVMLVLGAGLLVQSLIRLQSVESGFVSEGAVTFRVSLPASRYETPDSMVAFVHRLESELQALPGVDAAGAIGLLPFFSSQTTGLHVAGSPELEIDRVQFRYTTSGFFDAMGTRVLLGRGFDARDTEDAPPVIVINQALTRQLFGDESPIGKYVSTGWGHHPEQLEVIGVVEDVKLTGLAQPAPPAMYWPFGQFDWRSTMSFVVRTVNDPEGVVPTLRQVVTGLDPELAIYSIEALTARTLRSVAQERLVAWLLTAFAVLALVLGAVGTFGVMAYSVAQRTREIGVRVALGASPGAVTRSVLSEGARLAAIGVVLGLFGAMGLARFFAHLLYDTSAGDPATYLAVSALLLSVALTACFLPALRAARVDPMVVLRSD